VFVFVCRVTEAVPQLCTQYGFSFTDCCSEDFSGQVAWIGDGPTMLRCDKDHVANQCLGIGNWALSLELFAMSAKLALASFLVLFKSLAFAASVVVWARTIFFKRLT